MLTSRKLCVAILGAMLVSSILVVTTLVVVMESHPVPMSRLPHLQPGVTTGEVEQWLGVPTRVESSLDGDTWIYSSFTWCIVSVQFDSDGTVVDVDHDH